MTGQDTPRAAVLRRSTLFALCAALLSSCSSTSDPVARLGLTPTPAQNGLALAAAESDAVEEGSSDQPYFVIAEDDPELPEVASSVPTLQNRPEPAEAAAEQQVAAAPETGAQPAPERFAPGQQPVAAPLAQSAAGAIAAVESPPAAIASGSAFAAPQEQKKRTGFLASLFASEPAARPKPQTIQRQQPAYAAVSPAPPVALAAQPASTGATTSSPGALPGVRESGLFEIRRANGLDDVSDIDLHEDDDQPVQVASAAGLARLAPNGLIVQTDRVDVACLKPSLVRVLKQIESHYGRKVMVTSGYRSPPNNRRARGATNSLHMYCAAADIKVEGVTKFELAQFMRSMPGRGGVGTYCHTDAVHVDVGPERDWNWRCRRKKRR